MNIKMADKTYLLNQANGIKDELVQLRRRFHSEPELGFEEYKTSAFIADYLKKLGLKVQTGVVKTGVVATLEGALPGNVAALRADIDALPVTEDNALEYKSKAEGKMHACGHDAHTAMLLGAAKILSANKSNLAGTVKFIFQPAEESVAGAREMINDGVLRGPNVDVILGLHVIPDIETGHVEVKSGAIMSSMDEFEITVIGKGGHGSNPQNTVDPIATGAQLVMAIQTIVSRKVSPLQAAVISVCRFHAGEKTNVIPPAAYLGGTIRCQDESVRQMIFRQLDTVTKGICESANAAYQLKFNEQVPAVLNDPKLFDEFISCSSDILGGAALDIPVYARTYSEDFSLFGAYVPSLYFYLGTRNEKKDCVHPLHSPLFKMDEDILPLGTALFVNYCLQRDQKR
jgi:amidohydrolase